MECDVFFVTFCIWRHSLNLTNSSVIFSVEKWHSFGMTTKYRDCTSYPNQTITGSGSLREIEIALIKNPVRTISHTRSSGHRKDKNLTRKRRQRQNVTMLFSCRKRKPGNYFSDDRWQDMSKELIVRKKAGNNLLGDIFEVDE